MNYKQYYAFENWYRYSVLVKLQVFSIDKFWQKSGFGTSLDASHPIFVIKVVNYNLIINTLYWLSKSNQILTICLAHQFIGVN